MNIENKIPSQYIGIVVSVSAFGAEDRGFKSRQGVRCKVIIYFAILFAVT
jgi:hypothetical protein